MSVLINETDTVDISIQGLPQDENIELKFWVQHEDLIKVDPTSLTLETNGEVYKVSITGLHPG